MATSFPVESRNRGHLVSCKHQESMLAEEIQWAEIALSPCVLLYTSCSSIFPGIANELTESQLMMKIWPWNMIYCHRLSFPGSEKVCS